MSDSEHRSEALDGDVLGEQPGDDGLPGIGDFPPDQALGVNDPNLVASDDVAMRDARTRAELGERDGDRDTAATHPPSGDVLPPDGDDGHRDDVGQQLGSQAITDDTPDDTPDDARDDAVVAPEVDAVRVRDDG